MQLKSLQKINIPFQAFKLGSFNWGVFKNSSKSFFGQFRPIFFGHGKQFWIGIEKWFFMGL